MNDADRQIKPELIALTGGIGSGKSTVAEMFRLRGAHIIDADVLAREVVKPGSPGLNAVIERFGNEFLTASGELDRKRLGEVIFSDGFKREALEAIVHPLIRSKFLEAYREFQEGQRLREPAKQFPVMYVVPLYFESKNSYPEVNTVIVVWAPERVCAERLMERNGITEEQALKRIQAQIPIDKKVKKADFVIRNDGPISALESQVDVLWAKLSQT